MVSDLRRFEVPTWGARSYARIGYFILLDLLTHNGTSAARRNTKYAGTPVERIRLGGGFRGTPLLAALVATETG